MSNHVYVTQTLDAAVWGAELAKGAGRPRIYLVEPEGELEDDPNVTDKKFPRQPDPLVYRTREPVTVVGELTDWVGGIRPNSSRPCGTGLPRCSARGSPSSTTDSGCFR